MRTMEFGLDIWLLYPSLGLEKTLETVEREGFRYIEYPYEMFRDAGENLMRRVKEVAEKAKSYSVKPYQVHGEYGSINFELTSGDPVSREKALGRMEEWLRYASMLEADVLVVHLGFPRPRLDETYDRVIEGVVELNVEIARRLAEVGEEYGVKVAFENCVEPWFGASPADLLLLLEEADVQGLGVCLDTGHLNVNGLDVAGSIRRLGDAIIATHLHDNDGRYDQHLPPLAGSIDWREVLKAFREIKFDKPLIYEFGSQRGQSPENIVATLRLVTGYLKSIG